MELVDDHCPDNVGKFQFLLAVENAVKNARSFLHSAHRDIHTRVPGPAHRAVELLDHHPRAGKKSTEKVGSFATQRHKGTHKHGTLPLVDESAEEEEIGHERFAATRRRRIDHARQRVSAGNRAQTRVLPLIQCGYAAPCEATSNGFRQTPGRHRAAAGRRQRWCSARRIM